MISTLKNEFFKYLIAGTLAFISDFAVFLLFTKIYGVHYLIANAAGFCIGLTVSYLFCTCWVFTQRTYARIMVEFPIFLVVSGMMLLAGEALMLIMVEYFILPPAAAKILMTGIIFIGNFLLKKFILFHKKPSI